MYFIKMGERRQYTRYFIRMEGGGTKCQVLWSGKWGGGVHTKNCNEGGVGDLQWFPVVITDR